MKPAAFDTFSASRTATPYCVVVSGEDHYFGTDREAANFQREEGGDAFEIDRESGEWNAVEFDTRLESRPSDTTIQEKGHRSTSFGDALYIRIFTPCYRQLSWTEVWATFADSYPGKWAIQCFPPEDEVVDEQNIYHLFVLEQAPRGVSIKR